MSELESQSELYIPHLNELNEDLVELVAGIRTFSQSQVDTWRQLPYLALQAEGRDGYSHKRSKLYTYGLLHIDGDVESLFGTYIDCDNGNILRQAGKLDTDRIASDAAVMRAWLPDGEKFTAEKWLDYFESSAAEPHKNSASRTEHEAEQWRQTLARQLGLQAVFQRVRLVGSEEKI